MGYNFTFLLINKQIDINNHMAGKIFLKKGHFWEILQNQYHTM